MMVSLRILFLFLVLVPQSLYAQMWSVEVFDASGAMGMGSVVLVDDKVDENGWKYAVVVTADHVVDSPTGIRIKFEDGKSIRDCSVISRNREADVATIRCKVPKDVEPIAISDEEVEEGDVLKFCGRYRRKFSGVASCLVYDNEVWADVVVFPGDSGGAVMLDGKLVAVISGGLRWAANQPQRTWPCRSCNLGSIKAILDVAKRNGNWKQETKTALGDTVEFRAYKSGDLKEKGVVQLIVWSAEWCGPCNNMKLELKRRQAKLAELGVDRVIVVDVDLHQRLAIDNKIKLYPTTFIVEDGKIKATIKGASVNDVVTKLKGDKK